MEISIAIHGLVGRSVFHSESAARVVTICYEYDISSTRRVIYLLDK